MIYPVSLCSCSFVIQIQSGSHLDTNARHVTMDQLWLNSFYKSIIKLVHLCLCKCVHLHMHLVPVFVIVLFVIVFALFWSIDQ